MVFLEALFVASLIDLDTMTIPDGSTLPAMAVGVIGAVAFGQMYLVPVWFQDPALASYAPEWARNLFGQMVTPPPQYSRRRRNLRPPGLSCRLGFWNGPALARVGGECWRGLLIGGGLVWGVRLAGFLTLRREAMGFGDVILMALVGSFLGWQPTLVAFFIAPFFAMLVTAVRWVDFAVQQIAAGGNAHSLWALSQPERAGRGPVSGNGCGPSSGGGFPPALWCL